MKALQSFYRTKDAGIYFILALSIFFMLGEIINDRFWLSDLEVYYRSASRLLHGNNLYRYIEDGHYVFKYSPVSAAYFIPLLILPFGFAKIFYWLLLTIIIQIVFRDILRCSDPALINPNDKTRYNNIIICGAVLFAVHYLRELHLGQVNFLLLAIYIWSVVMLQSRYAVSYGFLIAGSIFLKPFGIIFIPWLIIIKRYREVFWILIGLAILSVIPLLFYRDFTLFYQQYAAWFNELRIELGNKQNLFKPANHTLSSVIARYFGFSSFMQEGSLIQKIYQLLLLLITGLTTLLYIRKEIPQGKSQIPLIYDLAFLTALIPMLSFTSENAFLFVLPTALIILSNWNYLSSTLKITAVTGLLLVGGNFSEITGKKLSRWLDDWSVLTPGTILLLIVIFILRSRIVKNAVTSPSGNTSTF